MVDEQISEERGMINTTREFIKNVKVPYYDGSLYDLLLVISKNWKHCGIFFVILLVGIVLGGIGVYKALFYCSDYFCWIESEIGARVTMTVASITDKEIVGLPKKELVISTTESFAVITPTVLSTRFIETSSATPTIETTVGTLTFPANEIDISQTTLPPTITWSTANLTSGCIHSDTWSIRSYINPEIDSHGCWKLNTEGFYSQKDGLRIYKPEYTYPFWIFMPLMDDVSKISFFMTIEDLSGTTTTRSFLTSDFSSMIFGVSSAGFGPNTKEQYLYFSSYSKNPPNKFVGYKESTSTFNHIMDYSYNSQYEVIIIFNDHEIEYAISDDNYENNYKASDVLAYDFNYFWIGYKLTGKAKIDATITDFKIEYSTHD